MVDSLNFIPQAMTEDQKAKIREHFMTVGMECMKDNPITEDDVKSLHSRQLPTGENVPCFLACVMKNVGVVRLKLLLKGILDTSNLCT